MRQTDRTVFIGVVCVVLAWFQVGLADEPLSRFEFHRKAMGVDFRIVLYAAEKGAAKGVAEAALDRVSEIDATCSDYRGDSELRLMCDAARPGIPFAVSRDLANVLEASQRVSRQTDGAFDVTLGPLTKLWRRARRQKELPGAIRLAEARKRVGYGLLKVDGPRRRVTLGQAGMRLDLGGIAKGYAVDRAMEVLIDRGFRRALVDGSGDLRVGDAPPGGRGWRVEVESLKRPGHSERRSQQVLELVNVAIATSGDAYQSVTIDGRRYSHILDPRTGMGLTRSSSVTVIARDATTADALASAISVMGPVSGGCLVNQVDGIELLFVTIEKKRRTVHRSRGWPGRDGIR